MRKADQLVLVVVDMQAHFSAAQDKSLITAVELDLERVNELSNGHIVAVNYDGSGASTVRLPKGTQTLWKNQDDGGNVVYSWLLGAGLVSKTLQVRICGVNLCACVFATASGLAQRLFDEHALCDNVTIDTSLCGEGSRYKIRLTI
jgi:hypothetical protein